MSILCAHIVGEKLTQKPHNLSLGTECEDDGVSFDRFHPSYKVGVEDVFLKFLHKAYRESSDLC